MTTPAQYARDRDMTQDAIQKELQSTPVIRCSGKCGRYHEIGYMVLHVPKFDNYYCYNCVMTTTNLREAREVLEGRDYGHPDPFTDAELNYASRRRMTDRENKQFNDAWIRAHWRLTK